MTIAAVLDGAVVHNGDIDISYVVQLSSVGALADEVLADLIKAEARLASTNDSAAIQRAYELFEATLNAADNPASLRARVGLSDALRRMSAVPHGSTEQASRQSSGAWLDSLKAAHQALRSAVHGQLQPRENDLLKAYFNGIAAGTMDATLGAVHPRSSASSWLTA